MVSIETFRKMALSFPGSDELSHFHLASFRYKKKIFATLWEKENRAMLKLSPVSQSVFCAFGNSIFFPVPGGWGRKGSTFVCLGKVRGNMLKDALTIAFKEVSAKRQLKKESERISVNTIRFNPNNQDPVSI